MNPNFIEIDDIVVLKEVVTEKFTCDLEKCKGACCTMKSSFGAPIHQNEIGEIERNFNSIKKFLNDNSIMEIKKNGFWESKNNSLMLRSVNKRDCVFVYYVGDIAKCSIEKAFFEGKSNFRKPISCHLFPIRINDFGGPILKFEKYDECKPALSKGKETNLSIAEFCRDALERAYSKSWLEKLLDHTGNI